MGDLVELIGRVTGKDLEIVEDPARVRPVGLEVERLLVDHARANELLGWESSIGLETGLGHTIAWIEARRTGTGQQNILSDHARKTRC